MTPVSIVDRGADNIPDTNDDQALQVFDRLAAPETRVFTQNDEYDSDYDTIEFALNRRMKNRWLLMTSVGYSWLKQLHGQTSSTSALSSGGNEKAWDFRPNYRRFGRETSTSWNYKVIGRYEFPWGIASSGSYKLQSGREYGRLISVNLPVAGTETFRAEPVTANRGPSVGILDLRFDKSFRLGRAKLTGMIDVFNLTNAGTVTGWQTATGTAPSATNPNPPSTFNQAVVLLDPRIVRLGIRLGF